MTNQWLKVIQAAEQIGTDRHRIYAAIKNGELRAANISQTDGRSNWRILQDDLDEFLESRIHHSSPPKRRRRKKSQSSAKKFF